MSILNLYAKPEYKMNLKNRIKWWFRRAKFVWQRAHWGFSEYDVWDFDAYHSELVAAMMQYWSEHNHSFHPEMTDEEWKAVLKKISECFSFWNEDLPTPAYETYCASVKRTENEDGSISVEAPDDVIKNWHEEEKANYELKKSKLKEGMDLLYKYYPYLWD